MALQLMIVHVCVLMASSPSPYIPSVSLIGLATRPNINVSTHLAHFVLAHRPGYIALVLEH